MSNITLILGECGSGKTTSLRNLNTEETFVINLIDKPLPFRGFREKFIPLSEDGKTGNYYAASNVSQILRAINLIDMKRSEFKYLVIDDFGYLMSNEYFSRASESGFNKFAEIGQHAWQVLSALPKLREDLNCMVLAHNELTTDGKYKMKTIGKMLDDKYTPEGVFPHIFHARVIDGKYKFLTQNDGYYMARNPLDMFETAYIDNDMNEIIKVYNEFYNLPTLKDNKGKVNGKEKQTR